MCLLVFIGSYIVFKCEYIYELVKININLNLNSCKSTLKLLKNTQNFKNNKINHIAWNRFKQRENIL